MSLIDLLTANPNPPALELGWVNLPELHDRIFRIERSPDPLKDEQVLTYLCAYGYAIHQGGPQQLARLLLQDTGPTCPNKLWFEFLPKSPRRMEGETHLDLAFGNLRRRNGTRSGIAFDPSGSPPSWIGFVEAKLLSDISSAVSYDVFRNQLLRVIENAVTLHDGNGNLPERVHVILLTPKLFMHNLETRYYGYKFQDYSNDRNRISADLDRLHLLPAHTVEIAERIAPTILLLHWATFEDVIANLPPGGFRESLVNLVARDGCVVRIEPL